MQGYEKNKNYRAFVTLLSIILTAVSMYIHSSDAINADVLKALFSKEASPALKDGWL